MDLLEIRKKAKEKKEAGAKPAPADEAVQAEQGAAGNEPEAGAGKPPDRLARGGKKRARGGGAAKKTAKEEPAASEPETPVEAPEEPGPSGAELPSERKEAAASPAAQEPAPKSLPPAQAEAPSGAVSGDEAPEEEEEEGDVLVEYLAFMLSDEEYAVRVEDVKEIIRLQRITVVPRAGEFVEGIISLRGVIIPVFDIKRRLGLEKSEMGRSTRIVIVSEGGSPQGIIVDKVTGVARLNESGIEPPPPVIGGVQAEYLEGVGRIGERLLILFNTRQVLSMECEEA